MALFLRADKYLCLLIMEGIHLSSCFLSLSSFSLSISSQIYCLSSFIHLFILSTNSLSFIIFIQVLKPSLSPFLHLRIQEHFTQVIQLYLYIDSINYLDTVTKIKVAGLFYILQSILVSTHSSPNTHNHIRSQHKKI